MRRTKPPPKYEPSAQPTMRRTKPPPEHKYTLGIWLPTDHITMYRADNNRKVKYLPCTKYGLHRLRKAFADGNNEPMTLEQAKMAINGGEHDTTNLETCRHRTDNNYSNV